ncbi:Superkiller protein 3 [Savitreella phatthalungensis]
MTKNLLKAARTALGSKDYEEALRNADLVLEVEPDSYNALVFRGLALTNLEKFGDARESYASALAVDQSNILAWQGLLTLSEKERNVPKYIEAAVSIATAQLADENDSDQSKCLATIEKALAFATEHGDLTDKSASLQLILPGSPFFDYLQDKLDSPSDTYERLATLLEEKESREISTAIAKGRQRLGVRLEDLTRQVTADVLSRSSLPRTYGELINWTHQESVRRDAETKLLEHAHRYLRACPEKDKPGQLHHVIDMARGMTLIKVPNPLAWTIELDWTDFTLDNASLEALCTYVRLFPDTLTTRAIILLLRSKWSPFATDRVTEQELDLSDEKRGSNTAIVASIEDAEPKDLTILAQRIAVRYYASEHEYDAVIDLGDKTAARIQALRKDTGLALTSTEIETSLLLAEALTFHQSPRFHARAMRLYQEVLDHGNNETASIGRARLLRISSTDRVREAASVLEEVLRSSPDNTDALLEHAICQNILREFEEALTTLGRLETLVNVETPRPFMATLHHQTGLARQALGQDEADIYASFIQALKFDANHAPAYTELGKYYADRVGDMRRAEKCFQKALELSSHEYEAARRLAQSFADVRDWDLVEIIAERVLQSDERLRISWPHLACALVHAHFLRWPQAITSYQAALRLDARNASAWHGLGEAYYELGRLQAAQKALARSVELKDDAHARLSLANVESALGEHEAACERLEKLSNELKSPDSVVDLCFAQLAWAESRFLENERPEAIQLLDKCITNAMGVLSSGVLGSHEVLASACMQLASIPGATEKNVTSLSQLKSGVSFSDMFQVTVEAKSCKEQLLLAAAKATSHSLDGELAHVFWARIGLCLGEMVPNEAVVAVQRAIVLQPENDAYWSVVGLIAAAHTTAQAFAHHALCKACLLNQKSGVHYANLGLFYLRHDRLEVANAAFSRAQTAQPDLASAWAGQSKVARLLGDQREADELLAHAFALARHPEQQDLTLAYSSVALDPLQARRPPGEFRRLLVDALDRIEQDGGDSLSDDDKDLVTYHCLLMHEMPDIPPAKDPQSNVIGRGMTNGAFINNVVGSTEATAAAEISEGKSDDASRAAVDEEAAAQAREQAAAQEKQDAEAAEAARIIELVEEADALAARLEEAYEATESQEDLAKYCDAKSLLARLQLRAHQTEEAHESAQLVISLLDGEDEDSATAPALKSARLVEALALQTSSPS